MERTHIEIVDEIRRLQADRQQHVEALKQIDDVLTRIASTLSPAPARSPVGSAPTRSAPFVANVLTNGALPATDGTTASDAPRRKYNKLPQTGEEFIRDFIAQRGAGTTLEINAAWRAQGRGGVANNLLGRLVKEGRLIREPLPDRRGSRYRLASQSKGHAA